MFDVFMGNAVTVVHVCLTLVVTLLKLLRLILM